MPDRLSDNLSASWFYGTGSRSEGYRRPSCWGATHSTTRMVTGLLVTLFPWVLLARWTSLLPCAHLARFGFALSAITIQVAVGRSILASTQLPAREHDMLATGSGYVRGVYFLWQWDYCIIYSPIFGVGGIG